MTALVSGRYRLDQRLASGGMGEVWRATDTVLTRQVAIKLLKSEYADDPTGRARFEAEARHAAQLHHPGIAAIFDFGEHQLESGATTAFLVMELVDGQPLSALLRAGEPLEPAATTRIIADAADAVQVAHDAGIVHRDIKPANLLVTPSGAVKVTDFGIARARDGVPLTQTGEVVGTPHYLAPEQAEGRTVTPASDVYSLAVVLYECLAGRRPFEASTPVAVALAHVRDQPPPLPDEVPRELADLCRKAMSKDPSQRPESAAAFASAVRGAAASDPKTKVLGGGAAPAAAAGGAAAGAAAGAADAPTGVTMSMRDSGAGRSRRWLVPALGAAAVLLVLAATVAMASVLGGDDTGTPPSSPESANGEPAATPSGATTPSEPARESPTPTPSQEAPTSEGAGDEGPANESPGNEDPGNEDRSDEQGPPDDKGKDKDKSGDDNEGKGNDKGQGRADDDD